MSDMFMEYRLPKNSTSTMGFFSKDAGIVRKRAIAVQYILSGKVGQYPKNERYGISKDSDYRQVFFKRYNERYGEFETLGAVAFIDGMLYYEDFKKNGQGLYELNMDGTLGKKLKALPRRK